jgi:hypothetical protein
MIIRDMRVSDIPRVKEIIGQQNFSYQEPDWLKMGGKVVEDDNGIVRIFELARPTVEMYSGIDDGDWATPGMKATLFEKLDFKVTADLRAKGYTDQHCWTPPNRRAFTRRLQRFCGWILSSGPDNWTGLTRGI